jgi:hypothetical protein
MSATKQISVRAGPDKVEVQIDANTTAGDVLAKIGRPDYKLVVNGNTVGKGDLVMPLLTGKDDIRANPDAKVG